MPLIQTSVLIPILDKLASRYKAVNTLVKNYPLTGGDLIFPRISATNDSDIELPLGNVSYITDNRPDTETVFKNAFSSDLAWINCLDGHFYRVSFVGGLDTYLRTYDTRVSDYFNQLYKFLRGQWMYADNVFCEVDTLFGTVNVITGLTIQFVDGDNFGIPRDNRRASGSDFAATQLKLVVKTFGGAQCDLRITGIDKGNNIIHEDVIVPSSAVIDDEIVLGTSRFLDVGSVAYFSSNKGTVGDVFEIRNIKERIII